MRTSPPATGTRCSAVEATCSTTTPRPPELRGRALPAAPREARARRARRAARSPGFPSRSATGSRKRSPSRHLQFCRWHPDHDPSRLVEADGQRVGELAEEGAVAVAAEGEEPPAVGLRLDELARIERPERAVRSGERPLGGRVRAERVVGREGERTGQTRNAQPREPPARVVLGEARDEDLVAAVRDGRAAVPRPGRTPPPRSAAAAPPSGRGRVSGRARRHRRRRANRRATRAVISVWTKPSSSQRKSQGSRHDWSRQRLRSSRSYQRGSASRTGFAGCFTHSTRSSETASPIRWTRPPSAPRDPGVEHVPAAFVLDHAPGPDGEIVPAARRARAQGVRENRPVTQVAGDRVTDRGVVMTESRPHRARAAPAGRRRGAGRPPGRARSPRSTYREDGAPSQRPGARVEEGATPRASPACPRPFSDP